MGRHAESALFGDNSIRHSLDLGYERLPGNSGRQGWLAYRPGAGDIANDRLRDWNDQLAGAVSSLDLRESASQQRRAVLEAETIGPLRMPRDGMSGYRGNRRLEEVVQLLGMP